MKTSLITHFSLFPSHWISFGAYLTTYGLLCKYKKCKSHSPLSYRQIERKGSQEAKQYMGRHVFLKRWLAQLTEVKPYMPVIINSPIILYHLKHFASVLCWCEQSFLFFDNEQNPSLILYEAISWGTLQTHRRWGYCLLGNDNTRPVEYRAASHRALLLLCCNLLQWSLPVCREKIPLFKQTYDFGAHAVT